MYRFDHSKDNLIEALGLQRKKMTKIEDDIFIKLVVEGKRPSMVIEDVMNNNNLSDVEKAYALFTLGKIAMLLTLIIEKPACGLRPAVVLPVEGEDEQDDGRKQEQRKHDIFM